MDTVWKLTIIAENEEQAKEIAAKEKGVIAVVKAVEVKKVFEVCVVKSKNHD